MGDSPASCGGGNGRRRVASTRWIAVAAALFLGGCGSLWSSDAEEARTQEVEAYCYSTLALADCYTTPLPDERRRLLGVGIANVPVLPD